MAKQTQNPEGPTKDIIVKSLVVEQVEITALTFVKLSVEGEIYADSAALEGVDSIPIEEPKCSICKHLADCQEYLRKPFKENKEAAQELLNAIEKYTATINRRREFINSNEYEQIKCGKE